MMGRIKVVWELLLVLLLAGCAFPGLPLAADPTATAPPLPMATFTPGPTDTPEPPTNCAFVWSNRSLPELSQAINQALRDAGVPEVDGEASAYGEDCLDPNTNTVVSFSTLQTDFYFSMVVTDLADTQAMGDTTETVLRVLDSLPAESVPGPNLGFVGFTFDAGGQTVNLWFPRTRGKELMEQNVSGTALFDALSAAP